MALKSTALDTTELSREWSTHPSNEEARTEIGDEFLLGQSTNGAFPHNGPWRVLKFSASENIWPLHWRVVSGSILIVAHLGNGWVLYKGFRQRTTRASTFHKLLISHSLTCFLLATFVYPIMQYTANVGILESEVESKFCHYGNLGMMWWASAGLFINGAVAVNRAMSCYPHWAASRVIRGHRVTWLIIAGIFLLTFLMHGVVALRYPEGWSSQFLCVSLFEVIQNRDHPDVLLTRQITRLHCGLSVVFALVMSLSSYFLIIWYLYGQPRVGATGPVTVSARRRREKLHALGVIAAVFGCFLICWTPTTWALIWKPELMSEIAIPVLAMTETAVTPIVYVATMDTYRPGWLTRRDKSGKVVPSEGSDTATGSDKMKTLKTLATKTSGN